jgi:hypothetical protein
VTLRVKAATLKYSPTYRGEGGGGGRAEIYPTMHRPHCRPRGCTNTCARRLRACTDSLAVLGKREITRRHNGVISRSFLLGVLFSEITRDFLSGIPSARRTADELDIMNSLDSCRGSQPRSLSDVYRRTEETSNCSATT